MIVLVRRNEATENAMFAKGAPESILQSSQNFVLQHCTLAEFTGSDRTKLHNKVLEIASKGLRVLAVAKKTEIEI